jgi:hypothetical protein
MKLLKNKTIINKNSSFKFQIIKVFYKKICPMMKITILIKPILWTKAIINLNKVIRLKLYILWVQLFLVF